LTNPWSFAHYKVILKELIDTDPNANFYEIVASGFKYSSEKILESDPLKIIESSYGYSNSLNNSLKGYKNLKNKYGDLIQIRFTKETLNSTVLLTNQEAFYEPYICSPIPSDTNPAMNKFEVRVDQSSYFFRYLRSYVQTLWQNSEPIDEFKEKELFYKENLSNNIKSYLDNDF
jgi:hypothetical protein